MSRRAVLKRLCERRLKLGTVSGVLTTRSRLIEWVDRNIPEIELITTKSYQVRANPGNREPILVEPEPGCFGNAVGLRNPGMEAGFQELAELRRRHRLRTLLCVSLSADCVEDFILLARRLAPVADLLELNFSCPHAKAGYGSSIGSSAETVRQFVSAIRRATPALLFPKLTPNVPDIGSIARAAVEAGADGISAINTAGPEVFREPLSGEPILYNPNGHKGGKSGEWIKKLAREKVAEIRRAIGPRAPIIGMGGVSTGADARLLMEAGADLVGIGSAFARVLRQEDLPAYVRALKSDAALRMNTASWFLESGRRMEYHRHRIAELRIVSDDLRLFVLEGSLPARAGEFAFLFLPGIGEKPFSVARAEPLSFLVRLRGEFTRALFERRAGDAVYVRGPYGAPAPESRLGAACLVAGGTGLAVVPELASELRRQGKRVELWYGVSRAEEAGALEELREAMGDGVSCVCLPDEGRQGRILEKLEERLRRGDAAQSCFYNIGPHPFLERALELEERWGASSSEVFACLETLTMCGVGLCGGCECGGRLACKEGAFVSLEFLRGAGIRLEELEADRSATASTRAAGGFSLQKEGMPAAASRTR